MYNDHKLSINQISSDHINSHYRLNTSITLTNELYFKSHPKKANKIS